MFTVTFIRHGESEDNSKSIWAGWKDAPLSELGVRQAAALGSSFSSVPITALYASTLKRAYSTAVPVQQYQPKQLELSAKPDLREQHFGIAEGRRWMPTHPAIEAAMSSPNRDEALQKTILDLAAQDIFPVIPDRKHKFPEGESLDDLAIRAKRALRECVLAHFTEYVANGGKEDVHVVAVSHGLCISEMTAALVALDPQADHAKSYRGLLNTAWIRAEISVRESFTGPFDVSNPAPLEVKVTHFNNLDHLKTLDTAAEAELDDARRFFAGATTVRN
ncbi:hypothetical protein AX14_003789 [Amanita brunnescens Koide BX004]|nr:hypothetical protein AX14_003789 [Amanita brunnescens Koide BX004]